MKNVNVLSEDQLKNLLQVLGSGIQFNGAQLVNATQHILDDSNEKEVLTRNVGQIGFNTSRDEFRMYNPKTGAVETVLSSGSLIQAIEEMRMSSDGVSESAVVSFVTNFVENKISEKLTGVFDSQGTMSDSMTSYPTLDKEVLGTRIAVWVATDSIIVKDQELESGDWLTYSEADGWGVISHAKNLATSKVAGVSYKADTFDANDSEKFLTGTLVANYVQPFIQEVNSLVAKLTERVSALENGLAGLGTKLTDFIKEIFLVTDGLKATDEKLVKDLSEVTKRVESAEAVNKTQDESITKLTDDASKLGSRVTEAELVNSNQDKTLSDIKSTLSEVDVKLKDVATVNEDQAIAISDLSTKSKDQSDLINSVGSDLDKTKVKLSEAQKAINEGALVDEELTSRITILESKEDIKTYQIGLVKSDEVFTYGTKDANITLSDILSFHIENTFGVRSFDGVIIDRKNSELKLNIGVAIAAGNYNLVVSGKVLK